MFQSVPMTPDGGSGSAGKTPTSLTPEMNSMLSLRYLYIHQIFQCLIIIFFNLYSNSPQPRPKSPQQKLQQEQAGATDSPPKRRKANDGGYDGIPIKEEEMHVHHSSLLDEPTSPTVLKFIDSPRELDNIVNHPAFATKT